ncbi:A disintegrin and metalloproteinase with thrombospondin motifs 12 [Ornithorhynchus anatinus]|uniref:ADAM metallopeptidase with thrombospondin type 1 motif 12 n=1 Tax=Ornithorhynchus anatinus TaxID=9258 RepID=F7CRY0_ORNAN|nr:A disintegrin and metalloproteinase with thrombospondin motifs 12 [Ornithorhynchus anatinus]
MPCAQRSWLARLPFLLQVLNFQALCCTRLPQPGTFYFPDKRQESFIKTLQEYHLVGPVRVDKSGHFVSYALNHHVTNARRRRDLRGKDDWVYYKISQEGKDLFFNLTVSRGFLSNNYVLEKRYGNLTGAKVSFHSGTSCHLTGTVLQPETGYGVATISVCNGLTGFFRLPHGDYFIEPVKEFQFVEGTHHLHIIYRRPGHPDFPQQKLETLKVVHPACGLNDSFSTSKQQEIQKERREKKHLSSRRLSRRSISKERWVETLVVADTKMIEYHGSENVESYILTIMNMVTGLFHNPSIGNAVHIVVVRLILLEEEEQGLKIVHHADKTLASFCKWQKSINPKSDLNPIHHDVAVLITRKDICSGMNRPCETLGLSHLSGICQPHRSCNINEDSGLPLAFTIAHEIGHSFGIQHDGRENDCEPVGKHPYIMSRQIQYDPTPLTWSKCSKEYITRFLDRGGGFCLDDIPKKKGLKSKVIAPGVIYDIHHQCQLQYGPNASFCQEVDNVCQTLWCSVKGYCRSKLDAAADGTRCGEKKWCMAGECITVGKKPDSIHGGWGAWSPWSHCSRTCGAGAQSSERLCNNPEPKFGGKYCTGERKRYRLCNILPCLKETPSFRQMQCSEFDTVPYRNEFYQWFPVSNPERPCELYCRPIDGQFSEKMLDAVADGTPCFEGSNNRNICINGMCKMVGCDYEIDSNATEDGCGVCLGDGSACQTVKRMFTQSEGFGYVDIGLIPKGARGIKVEEIEEAGNFLAVRSEDPEKYYLNGGFIIQWNGDYKLAGTVFQYDRKGDLENLIAAGPTNESVWLQLLFQVNNPGIKYEYTIRKDSHENDIEKPEYFWQYSSWTDCSVTCGTGIRRQTALCVKKGKGMVKASFCDPEAQPNRRQKKCQEKDCPPRWWAGDWQTCSTTCGPRGEKKRMVLCIQTVGSDEQALTAKECQHLLKPKSFISCNRDVLCPSDWTVGNWSECTVSCGGGVRIRSITCAKNSDEPCDVTKKPNSRALCGLQQCPPSRKFSRPLLHPNPGTLFNKRNPFRPTQEPLGLTLPPMPSQRSLTSPTVPGSRSWWPLRPTPPGPMTSSPEGSSQRTFPNNLTQSENHDPFVSPGNTTQQNSTPWLMSITPRTDRTTNYYPKESISVSETGATSEGPSTSNDLILPHTMSPGIFQVTPGYDYLTEEPETETPSGSGEADEAPTDKSQSNPIIWTESERFKVETPSINSTQTSFQLSTPPYLSASSKSSSKSPAEGNLLSSTRASPEDTPLQFSIPGTEKPLTETLLPDGRDEQTSQDKFVTSKELEPSNNETLVQGTDSQLTEEDAKNLIAEGFLLNATDYKHLEGVTTTQKTTYWVVGNWSECSTSCGLGVFRRPVECSTGKDADCDSIQKPDPTRRCHLRPCARWKTGNWSKCSKSCGGGVRERPVRCPGHHCDWKKKPNSSVRCNDHPCSRWVTGTWNVCPVSCGGGIQQRIVQCISTENNTTQDHSLCEHEPKPLKLQKCNTQECRINTDLPCSSDKLSAHFCQKLKAIGKCFAPAVRVQCCHTCPRPPMLHSRRHRSQRGLRKPKFL